MLWTNAAAASRRPPVGTAAARDPLYAARRTLHTGAALLTDKQRQRLTALFADDEHVEVEATWGIYQHMIAAYREPDPKRGRELMQQLIDSISHSVPIALREVITLGRTLKRRPGDVLAYFDRPGTSNGPTEAINGRLEHLRGSALGFRNLTNYIARSLLETRRVQAPTLPSIMKSQEWSAQQRWPTIPAARMEYGVGLDAVSCLLAEGLTSCLVLRCCAGVRLRGPRRTRAARVVRQPLGERLERSAHQLPTLKRLDCGQLGAG